MPFLAPKSIAVIGASSEPGKVGHYVFQNLVEGYVGPLYPVNNKRAEILGRKTYASVTDIPAEVDVAIVITPATTVTAIADECGKKGVHTLVVISAGFGEIGTEEGRAREKELKAIVDRYPMRLIGPNCLGFLRPALQLNASFAAHSPKAGKIALISQSGAMAVALMDAAAPMGLGFSLVVSMGNKTAMDECDFLELCEEDPETQVIALYVENISSGRRFLELARRIARRKTIVLIKAGTSAHGKRAVSSHTGAMAGSESAISAVCSQAGIRRAKTTEEFLDILHAVSTQPPLLSPNIAIVTNAGGPGILAADAAEREGARLPVLHDQTIAHLKSLLPEAASTLNPIDVLGDALADRYGTAVEAAGSDPNIDGTVVVLTPQVMTPATDVAQAIKESRARHPLMPIVTSFMGNAAVKDAVEELHRSGIPNYPTPERAIRAIAHLRPMDIEPTAASTRSTFDRATRARALIHGQVGLLSPTIISELFAVYGLPTPEQEIATSEDEAAAIAERIGYPVIAKIASPEIIHKTDVGGVRANIMDEHDVRLAYREIMGNVTMLMNDLYLEGILIQKFLPAGNEFIVGAAKDPSFGHLLMIGLGGIYTELFQDVTFRIAPITEGEVYRMLQELKSWRLLLGMRGKAQSDIDALVRIVLTISDMVMDCPEIRELDLNPVFVDENGTVVLDAKVMVG